MSDDKIDYEIPYPGEGIILEGIAIGTIKSADIVVEPELYSNVWEVCDFTKYGIKDRHRCGIAISNAIENEQVFVRLAYEI